MFTGLVQALGIVIGAQQTDAGKRLTISLAELAQMPLKPGDSLCVSGVCLTATKVANGNATFDVVAETLHRSTLGRKQIADRVNLELPLRADSYIGGHFVQGHVDAVAKVVAVHTEAADWRIVFDVPREILVYIAPKGSIAVDGVSMTIAEVRDSTFTLAVIPATLEHTTLSILKPGDVVNVETDILSRTVVHFLRQQNPKNKISEDGGVTLAKLIESGFA